jgi:hypothetical protein
VASGQVGFEVPDFEGFGFERLGSEGLILLDSELLPVRHCRRLVLYYLPHSLSPVPPLLLELMMSWRLRPSR